MPVLLLPAHSVRIFPLSQNGQAGGLQLSVLLLSPHEQKMFENMKNGLYKPASLLCPVISGILNDFKKMGFPLYSMTGSGNACFALSKDLEQIEKAKNYFTSLNYITITASTNLTNQETIYNSSLFSHKGA